MPETPIRILSKISELVGARPARRLRLSAERKAVLAEQRLREAIEALPEGIVFLDADGRYVLWNQSYADIYSGTADLFEVGAKFADTLRVGVERGEYPDAIGREEAWIAERLTLLGRPGERLEQRLKDGRWILIEERKTSDGGLIGIRVDVTDLKLAEQAAREARERAEAASRAKSDFLANMSHEVRTPLNGVLGLAQVLLRTELDPQQRELMQSIVSSAHSLNRVLSDVLDLSRAESGRMEIRREPFDLPEFVAQVSAFFASQAADKGIAFHTRLDPALGHCRATGDADRLHQVLANLMGNALKFTSSGSITLEVLALRGDVVRFRVQDTGIGFAPGAAERLFERFEQADGSITRVHGGSGLGLAICRELTTLMGGVISATAEPGRGAEFTVDLPLPRDDRSPAVGTDVLAPTGVSLSRPRHILLAEDNPINRKVVSLTLGAAAEFHIDVAENGAEALEMSGRFPYDLILMDLSMPVLDGLSATRAIRARERQTASARVPIVVLSAHVMAEHVAEARAAGADAHLGKPFDIAELVTTVVTLSGIGDDPAQARSHSGVSAEAG